MRIFIQNEIQKLSSDFTHSNVFLCKQESRKLKKDWIITGTEMTLNTASTPLTHFQERVNFKLKVRK